MRLLWRLKNIEWVLSKCSLFSLLYLISYKMILYNTTSKIILHFKILWSAGLWRSGFLLQSSKHPAGPGSCAEDSLFLCLLAGVTTAKSLGTCLQTLRTGWPKAPRGSGNQSWWLHNKFLAGWRHTCTEEVLSDALECLQWNWARESASVQLLTACWIVDQTASASPRSWLQI